MRGFLINSTMELRLIRLAINTKDRHAAYRELARFLFGLVGLENRYVLPSCAVPAIGLLFPVQMIKSV